MDSIDNAKLILNLLSNRTLDYLINDMHLEIKNSTINIEIVNSFSLEEFSALIALKEDMNGTIGLSTSTSLTHYLTRKFVFGEVSVEEVEDMAAETIAEILNIVLGNILKNFPIVQKGGKVNISTPYIMTSSSEISKSKKGSILICRFDTNHGKVILTYFI